MSPTATVGSGRVVTDPNELRFGMMVHIFVDNYNGGNGVVNEDLCVTDIDKIGTDTRITLSDGSCLVWPVIYQEWDYYLDKNDQESEVGHRTQVTRI